MAFRHRSALVVIAFLAITPASALAQESEPVVVEVTNTNNVVNGDTTSIPALIATTGGDGISLAEAVLAANATVGTKIITFPPEMTGKTIEVTASAEQGYLYVIDTLNLTIDGDLDDNGTPDVTLLAPRDSVVVFLVRSSNVTIRGLRLVFSFPGAAIRAACADLRCDQRLIRNLEISGNEIINLQGTAVAVGPELVRAPDIPFLTDITYENIVISGNTMNGGEVAISLTPSVDGIPVTRTRNVRIENNTISGANGVRATAAHRVSPPQFGDTNLIDGLTIASNRFEMTGSAITVFGSDYGNSNNRITGLQINGNTIVRSSRGIEIAAAIEGKPQRIARGNVVENVTVNGNQITASARGITISGADWPLTDTDAIGFESNLVRNISVRDNTIGGYTESGIRVWGGFSNSFAMTVTRNTVQDLTIANNRLSAGTRNAIGILILGGEARGGTARENAVRGLVVTGNQISGHATGVLLGGGNGPQTQSNVVDVLRFGTNTLDGNDIQVAVAENSNSAAGNTVRFPRRRAVR